MSRIGDLKERALCEGMPLGAERTRLDAIDWLAARVISSEDRHAALVEAAKQALEEEQFGAKGITSETLSRLSDALRGDER